MTTTSIRLPEDLKQRVASLAALAGTTAHSFIVEAVQQRVEQAQVRNEFLGESLARMQELDFTGRAVPWVDARQYLLDRAEGKKTVRPKAAKTTARKTTR